MVALRRRGGTEGGGGGRQLPLDWVREDALPEHTAYRDTGCDLAPSCLRCPLERCKYDEPGGGRRLVTELRDREIVRRRRRGGARIDELARTYGLTRRSIFRILRDSREQRSA